ncbi:hypothetical protein O181_129331 [Austropuccinia psidii MF-1]|uniref:Uncharacterized protein n=1 Tax=Austropuccinia psidii MF-1 TaxID=1389203 RepID=A0A9Q3L0M1_9BASI|nr:hypothetical protein [Austropuccinia psidii MF-1]
MSNITPNSQLSAYELIQRSLVQVNEHEETQNSPIVHFALDIQNKQVIWDNLNASQQTIDKTPSQISLQKHKFCTHEEAQLHWKQIEHEHWFKRQRKMDK